MKSSEEIAETIVKRGYSDITSDEEYEHWINVVANDIEKHTNATLSELEKEVKYLSDDPSSHMHDSAYLGAIGDVLEIITKAKEQ